jgi:hypothetical protein
MIGDRVNETTGRNDTARIGDASKGLLSELRAKPVHSGDAGTTAGSYTATSKWITRVVWCAGTGAGSCTITPAGGDAIAITIPADSGWFGLQFAPGELPAASTVVFADVASNLVLYAAAS